MINFMQVPFKIIGVFTDLKNNIRGNTSAVVELPEPISEDAMQNIANDMNQPATTFIWKNEEKKWHVRWYAADGEIMLCGHGSMAAIAYLDQETVALKYGHGIIHGTKQSEDNFTLIIDPIYSEKEAYDPIIAKGLGVAIEAYYKNDNKHLVVVKDEDTVQSMKPNFELLKKSKPFGYVVTAPGSSVDFVSRTIVPKVIQLEDSATGSSHAALVPYWSERLKKSELSAMQLSERGGYFLCKYENKQVSLTGQIFELANGLLRFSK